MEFDPSIFTQMGLIQKISTGNWALDVMLCSLLPVLFKHLWPQIKAFVSAWLAVKEQEEAEFTRTIDHIEKRDYYWGDRKCLNHVLQKAILLYIGSQPDVVARFDQADYTLEKVKNEKRITTLAGELAYKGDPDNEDDDEDQYDWEERELRRYMVNVVPPRNAWVKVTDDGVEFCRDVNGGQGGGEGGNNDNSGSDKHVTFTLKATGPDARKRVDAFVDAAFAAYKNKMKSENDVCRYLYTPLGRSIMTNSNDDDDNGIQYKQYKLSDDKKFTSFFHPEKDRLVKLVNNFMNKEGKYAISGYPHKLGLLLYGPPGTGKTSLIKALAQHTKRHIVNIPLAKVRTNQELMDIIFDQHFNVVRSDMPKNLSFSRTIFVMEDVDAAADVVLARSGEQCTAPMPMLPPKQPASVKGDDNDDDDGDDNNQKRKSKEGGSAGKGGEVSVGWYEHPDKLNLAGLLNVLDGVVDCPGRIVVMTSNHPERLDPALIRPGRIDKKLYLGHLDATSAANMVRHYYGEDALTESLAARLTSSWVDGTTTPAELEMLCAQNDEVHELLDALASRGGPSAPPPPARPPATTTPSPSSSLETATVVSDAVGADPAAHTCALAAVDIDANATPMVAAERVQVDVAATGCAAADSTAAVAGALVPGESAAAVASASQPDSSEEAKATCEATCSEGGQPVAVVDSAASEAADVARAAQQDGEPAGGDVDGTAGVVATVVSLSREPSLSRTESAASPFGDAEFSFHAACKAANQSDVTTPSVDSACESTGSNDDAEGGAGEAAAAAEKKSELVDEVVRVGCAVAAALQASEDLEAAVRELPVTDPAVA